MASPRSVRLSDDVLRRLADVARRNGASVSSTIERLLDEEARPKPTLPLFRSGDPTLAERVDEALAGFGE